MFSHSFLIVKASLTKPTSFLGIPLWILLVASISAFIILVVIISLCICCICFRRRRQRKSSYESRFSLPKPIASNYYRHDSSSSSSLDKRLLSGSSIDVSGILMNLDRFLPNVVNEGGREDDGDVESIVGGSHGSKNVWRQSMEFGLQEIMEATNGFHKENVIGSGDHGSVYLGLLRDNTRVAVKMLVSYSCETEEFALQMDAIGCARHKKLVRLLGYCTEGVYRMSVSEYIDNGNLYQWLHQFPGQVSPLTWETRSNIILGVAKGLAYLHEDVEPKILHGSLKSSNILLDHHWNPKISDFGLSNLFTTNMMETSSESNDIYSFGVLIMEIISGRIPLDHSLPQEDLIDWFKSEIGNENIDHLVDSKLPEMPPSKDFKQMILVSLRCVDPDVNPKLKMGDVIRMLEPRHLLLSDEYAIAKEVHEYSHSPQSDPTSESGDSP